MRALTVSALGATAIVLGACGQSMTAPELDMTAPESAPEAQLSAEINWDPLDPNRATYTFNDLTVACDVLVTSTGLYEDLAFPDPVQLAACVNENGTVGLRPSGLAGGATEIPVMLPRPAEWVSIESFMIMMGATPTLIAYDAAGAEIGRSGDATLFAWRTLRVDGGGTEIASIGLSMPQWVSDLDNLTVQYVPTPDPDPDPDPDPEPDPTPDDPVTKADCFHDGWEAYGFKNQGMCVRYIETGRDSR